MLDTSLLINRAQQLLQDQPFDIVHDFEHHQLVHNNYLAIVETEGLEPDKDVLDVATWWHDLEKSYETSNSADSTIKFLRAEASRLDIPADFIEKCIAAIGEHSFTEQQTHLESYILFDADKIEYVNAERIRKLTEHSVAHREDFPPSNIQEVYNIWTFRLTKVPDMMHFEYSKQRFGEKLADTQAALEELLSSLF